MPLYSFGDVTVDEEGFQARRGPEPLDLEPKALEMLFVLVRRPGQLVTKAEIQAAVWPDTAVTESALTRVVAQLRKALDDDARDARYIETVPTRGYRFIAPVAVVSTPSAPPASGPSPSGGARSAPRHRSWMAVAALAAAGLLGIAAWKGFRAAPGAAAERSPRPVLLSTAPGINGFPTFSPDGASLAFASDRTGSFEIYARGIDPAAAEVAITRDGQQNLQPAWSPDGRWVAYTSLGRGGLWIVPALGGAPRRLSAFGARPAWSPDSRTIVFQSQTPTHPLGYAGGSGSVLYTAGLDGSEPRQLTARSGWGDGSPSFSPDGTRIAYAAGESVFTVRADGTDSRLVHDFGADVDNVLYARDGRSLYVALVPWAPGDPGRVLQRVPVRPDGSPDGEVTSVGAAETPLRGQLAIAPDGRRIAYIEAQGEHGLYVATLGPDGGLTSPPRPLLPQLALRPLGAVFSADGRRIAFSAFRPGGGWFLWIAEADGGRADPVRAAPVVPSYLSWLDDGRIVFTEPVPDGGRRASRLVAFDPRTAREEILLEPPYRLGSARVTLDGSKVAFMRADRPEDVFQVWTADLPRGTPRKVTSDSEGAGWPFWSADGRTLAAEAFRRGDTVLGVLSDGVLRPLVTTPTHSWPGDFSADGRRVVYAAQRGGVWNVCAAEVGTGAERCLTSYTRFDGYVRMPALSRAGDRVVFERTAMTATLWMGTLP